ncbi:MAG: DUF5596 domain-containing protein [Clostridia bacterium]|jgi:hypothetical protein|nr:DUF5596 domain-containing protein [Clostridia bacterium]
MRFEVLKYLTLDERLLNKLESLDSKSLNTATRLGKMLAKDKTISAKHSKLIKLAAALKGAEETLLNYENKGISEEIFAATIDDIRIWCENCNNVGLNNIEWIKNHIAFKLFKIGRLQYQFFTYDNPQSDNLRLPFSDGEKLVFIHIPQGEKLTQKDCVQSIKSATEFFNCHFPEYKYEYYFCESWLLYENNVLFMNGQSNIVKFMNLFNIHYSVNDESQALERIFGADKARITAICGKSTDIRTDAIQQLPELTSLQKSAKKYLLDGNKLGFGVGTIPNRENN